MSAKHKAVKRTDADAQRKARAEKLAKLAFVPELNAAAIAEQFSVTGEPDLWAMVDDLRARDDAVVRGDTQSIERMLAAQAHALDAMFASLARRAKAQENLATYDAHLKFALRAQNQCRMTLETLATIKNPPPVAFVRQANIANGPQQVNNGEPVARAEQNANRPTELLEAPHAKPQWMDDGTAESATAGDPALEAVATINRTANG